MASAKLDRRGAEAVLGEDAGDRATLIQSQQREITPVQLADAGFGEAEADAGNGEQGFGGGRGEIDGHLQPLSERE